MIENPELRDQAQKTWFDTWDHLTRKPAKPVWARKRLWVLAAAVLYWGYVGFPSPDTLYRYWSGTGESECVAFAEKNKASLVFLGSRSIKAMSSWLTKGREVVEIGLFSDGEDTYTPRICVIGGGTIQIVSIFENNAWR